MSAVWWGLAPSCMNQDVADKSSKAYSIPNTRALIEYIVWKSLYHEEKRSNYTYNGNNFPYSHFWRTEWSWNTHMRVLKSPKSSVLFIEKVIEIELCFIWKLRVYAFHINIATINHFQQIICNLHPIHYG